MASALLAVFLIAFVVAVSECEGTGAAFGAKCEISSEVLAIFVPCDEESQEAAAKGQDKGTALFLCIFREIGWIDENNIANQETTIASIDTSYITDDLTKQKLTIGFNACFVGFTPTAEKTHEVLTCLDMMQNWACEKPADCKNNGQQTS